MKDRQARSGVEARRRHVEVVTDADDIGVRVVRVEDGIFISAVAVIGGPNFRDGWGRCRGLRKDARRREREKENRDRL